MRKHLQLKDDEGGSRLIAFHYGLYGCRLGSKYLLLPTAPLSDGK